MPHHIFLGDATLRSGSGDLAKVEIVLFGDAPHQRRGALRLRHLRCGHLNGLAAVTGRAPSEASVTERSAGLKALAERK
jgi:hypothetical protein